MNTELTVRSISKLFEAELRPISAFFEVTYRCNAHCCHCLLDRDVPEMALDDVVATLDVLRKLGAVYLVLSGGEPFMRDDFIDIVGAARARRFAVRVLSNAMAIDAAKARALATHGIISIEISLLGATPETYEAVTGVPDALVRVVDAVKLLKQHGVVVVAKAPLLSLNFAERHAIVRLAKSLGAHWRTFDPIIIPTSSGQTGPLTYSLTPDQLYEYYREQIEQGLILSSFTPYEGDIWKTKVCKAGISVIGVAPDGRISPCGGFRLPDPGIYPLRDGRDSREMWLTNAGIQEVRGLTVGDLEGCDGCDAVAFCSRCPAVGFSLYGTVRRMVPTYCAAARALQAAYKDVKGTRASATA